MHESKARDEMCRIGKSLFDRGYVHACAGNISLRLDDGFLITPTDACLGFLDPAALSKLDQNGVHVSGDRPSKTILLHRQIYRAARAFDANTACVIHTHSTACVGLSLHGATGPEWIPALTPYFVMKVGHVPFIPYHRPGAQACADLVEAAITAYGQRGCPIRSVMLERLGPNVWHDTPAAAMATLEELEETAALWLACRQSINAPAPLTDLQITELREVFGARW